MPDGTAPNDGCSPATTQQDLTPAVEPWGLLLIALSQVERAQYGDALVCAIDLEADGAVLTLASGGRVAVPHSVDAATLAVALHTVEARVQAPPNDQEEADRYPAEYSERAWWAELLYDFGGLSLGLSRMLTEPRVLSLRRRGGSCFVTAESEGRTRTVEISLRSDTPPFDTITDVAEVFWNDSPA